MTTTRTTRPEAWTRFLLGAFTCTVVSDGLLEMGPARTDCAANRSGPFLRACPGLACPGLAWPGLPLRPEHPLS